MNTTSALGEKSADHVFDASCEDELPSEQDQWCPLMELCFHYTVGRVLVKALGVHSTMRVSETCTFAISIARVDRESQDTFFAVIVKGKKNCSHDAMLSEGQFCSVDAPCCVQEVTFPDDWPVATSAGCTRGGCSRSCTVMIHSKLPNNLFSACDMKIHVFDIFPYFHEDV